MLMQIPSASPEYTTHRVISALEAIENPYSKLIVVRRKTVRVIPLR